MAFHATNFYHFKELLLIKLYGLYNKSIGPLKSSFFGFMNEKLAKVPDEERSIKPLYSKNKRLFEYDSKRK